MRNKKYLIVLISVVAILALAVFPVGAVTAGGEPDTNNDYPHVALMVAIDANGFPLWRCSGTFLTDTVYLTAGHCTESPAVRAEIWLAQDVESGIPGNGYPFTGDVSGVAYTHPEYDPGAFFYRDVGVVVLDGGDTVDLPVYGVLPQLDELDAMQGSGRARNAKSNTFTAVGYGLQLINPVFIEAERVRHVAHPHLLQINVPGFTGDFSVLLSNNHSTGGTCFGDSGGPNFIGDSNVVGGVTSFGINGNCAGTGGVFRMDRSWSLDWVGSFLP
ncbi:MAG TPA: trypsin-like serine protease [Anaerolineales bacterium]|nr:trypsin-like serine protease [Anaerolineales bacterium]